jgi:hypothetical protein
VIDGLPDSNCRSLRHDGDILGELLVDADCAWPRGLVEALTAEIITQYER